MAGTNAAAITRAIGRRFATTGRPSARAYKTATPGVVRVTVDGQGNDSANALAGQVTEWLESCGYAVTVKAHAAGNTATAVLHVSHGAARMELPADTIGCGPFDDDDDDDDSEGVPQLLTYAELSAASGVPVNTLRQQVLRGKIPAPDFRLQNMPVWLPGTVAAWLAAHTREAAQ